ncbi:MAG: thioredoxin family protein [Rhodospirillales bacterium]|nr:thioredoxin family protein [Rhodospirillales bacterium]
MPSLAAPPDSGASPWIKTAQTSVRLVSASDGVGAGKTVRLGLQFKLKDNWKIYWRDPGDAGFPPNLDWTQSSNLKKTTFLWPAPTRFEVLGLQTMGYKKEVVFPITAELTEPGKPLLLRAKLNYLACDDVCIPYSAKISLDLDRASSEPTSNFHLINKYTALVPGNGSGHGLTIAAIETAGALHSAGKNIKNGVLRIAAKSTIPFQKPDLFLEGPESIFFSPPTIRLSKDGKNAVLLVPVSVEEDAKIESASVTLTLTDGNRSAERRLTVTRGLAESPTGTGLALSLPIILALAVLGGLILNLMPCVLPVLSLKVLSFVSHGGAEKRTVRRSFVASSLGIFISFLVIASALVGLKQAGAAVGWGIQFQHPWFIVGLTIIVTLFAYNLWGLFEFRLPSFVGNIAARGGGEDRDPNHQSFSGNFATGAFATILATPCSAPFLGTAIGFALAGSIFDIYAVFAALGLGMALPFILIALAPGLASKFPKPGRWMIRLKQILGLALFATALWLLSVLAAQLNFEAAAIVGATMIGIGALLFGRPRVGKSWRQAASAGIAVLVLAAFATPYQLKPVAVSTQDITKAGFWRPFDAAAIPSFVAQGKTVFVDITAEWCITCLVNKGAVLNRGEVFKILNSDQIVAMQGDWTRPDPKITDYLNSFNRFGIPFNAVYGPGNVTGIVLPELLTPGAVLGAFEEASANKIVIRK